MIYISIVKWLSLYEAKRLEIARSLLNRDGVTFISIDEDNKNAPLKCCVMRFLVIQNFIAHDLSCRIKFKI